MRKVLALVFIGFMGSISTLTLASDDWSAKEALLNSPENINFRKITRLNDKKVIYEIEICPTNKCDLFEAGNDEILADYVYLYSVYIAGYLDFTKRRSDGKYEFLDFIRDANKTGHSEHLKQKYVEKFDCAMKNSTSCMMKGFARYASIKQYEVTYDEGGIVKSEINPIVIINSYLGSE